MILYRVEYWLVFGSLVGHHDILDQRDIMDMAAQSHAPNAQKGPARRLDDDITQIR
jgi:hypothetical protein